MDGSSSQQPLNTKRRRQGPNHRSAAHKAYASENDVSTIRSPRTPGKQGSALGAGADGNYGGGSKQRGKHRQNKTPKNQPTSPDSRGQDRQTPPHRASSSSTTFGVGTAFAGATFHASPAPSALPIPSFLSKSSNESPLARRVTNAFPEPSPPTTDTDARTPFRPSSVPQPHESPLDFMFRAHREEKKNERHDDNKTDFHTGSSSRQNSPAVGLRYDQSTNSPTSTNIPQNRLPITKDRFDAGEEPNFEDKTTRLMGPAFSTPYQERIKAARTVAQQSYGQERQEPLPTNAYEDPSEALKKFLFRGKVSDMSAGPASPLAAAQPRAEPLNTGQPNNIQAMEDSLRRILKLDPGTDNVSQEKGSRVDRRY